MNTITRFFTGEPLSGPLWEEREYSLILRPSTKIKLLDGDKVVLETTMRDVFRRIGYTLNNNEVIR